MAGWYYRLRRRYYKQNKAWLYDVVEFFPKCRDIQVDLWMENGVTPIGFSKKEVVKELRRMIKDCQKYPVLVVRKRGK